MIVEGSFKSEIIIKQGLEPEIIRRFRPDSKIKKMGEVFRTSNPKEIKKIMDMVKERFFNDWEDSIPLFYYRMLIFIKNLNN